MIAFNFRSLFKWFCSIQSLFFVLDRCEHFRQNFARLVLANLSHETHFLTSINRVWINSESTPQNVQTLFIFFIREVIKIKIYISLKFSLSKCLVTIPDINPHLTPVGGSPSIPRRIYLVIFLGHVGDESQHATPDFRRIVLRTCRGWVRKSGIGDGCFCFDLWINQDIG